MSLPLFDRASAARTATVRYWQNFWNEVAGIVNRYTAFNFGGAVADKITLAKRQHRNSRITITQNFLPQVAAIGAPGFKAWEIEVPADGAVKAIAVWISTTEADGDRTPLLFLPADRIYVGYYKNGVQIATTDTNKLLHHERLEIDAGAQSVVPGDVIALRVWGSVHLLTFAATIEFVQKLTPFSV